MSSRRSIRSAAGSISHSRATSPSSPRAERHDALHLYDVVTRRMMDTFRFKSIVSIGSTSWAPDGTRLVFSAHRPGGQNDLYVLDTDTRELQRLTNDYYDDRDPAWSPRATRIAFSSDRTPFGENGKYNSSCTICNSGVIEYLTYGNENA